MSALRRCATPIGRSRSSRGSTRSRRTPASTSSGGRSAPGGLLRRRGGDGRRRLRPPDLARRPPDVVEAPGPRRPARRAGRPERGAPPDPRHARVRGPLLPRDRRPHGHEPPVGRVDVVPRPQAAHRGVRRARLRPALRACPGHHRRRVRRWPRRSRPAPHGPAPSYCQPCRRHAYSAGLGDVVPAKTGVGAKIAAWLPMPFFLQKRLLGLRGGGGSDGSHRARSPTCRRAPRSSSPPRPAGRRPSRPPRRSPSPGVGAGAVTSQRHDVAGAIGPAGLSSLGHDSTTSSAPVAAGPAGGRARRSRRRRRAARPSRRPRAARPGPRRRRRPRRRPPPALRPRRPRAARARRSRRPRRRSPRRPAPATTATRCRSRSRPSRAAARGTRTSRQQRV